MATQKKHKFPFECKFCKYVCETEKEFKQHFEFKSHKKAVLDAA